MNRNNIEARTHDAQGRWDPAWELDDRALHESAPAVRHPITMISTPLPPAMCGIGSYTAMLARHWPDPHQVVHFVTTGAEASRRENPHAPIMEVRANVSALRDALSELRANDLLLQYAARGYSRLGVPLWILGALREWRRRVPGRRLAIFVHELWADLPLTHRRGILERLNRWLIRELALLSDVVMTNTLSHQRRLEFLLRERHVEVIPVGTNIAPPGDISEIRERKRDSFVIFGRAFGRVQTLQRLYPHLQQWHAAGILRELHLIGPLEDRWEHDESELLQTMLPASVIQRHGPLPDAAVSRILSASAFALSGQTRGSLMKSTTFMAFASHGCCVVDAEETDQYADPVCREGILHASELGNDHETLVLASQKANALRSWHEGHASWPVISHCVATAVAGHIQD